MDVLKSNQVSSVVMGILQPISIQNLEHPVFKKDPTRPSDLIFYHMVCLEAYLPRLFLFHKCQLQLNQLVNLLEVFEPLVEKTL